MRSFLQFGELLPVDLALAAQYLRRSASLGCVPALHAAAVITAAALGVPRDVELVRTAIGCLVVLPHG